MSSSAEGTFLAPLSTILGVRLALGFLPCASGTATSAAVSAIWMIGW